MKSSLYSLYEACQTVGHEQLMDLELILEMIVKYFNMIVVYKVYWE